ncbi:hypothetical protein WMY93_008320 [Mugilogobius chulae]|uniref:Rho guanine nucleotide exchange factor 12-like n=1 Tax=Mugilogobius chulae TaxID=88201 RepID=A0AAW0PPI7_9GOBI
MCDGCVQTSHFDFSPPSVELQDDDLDTFSRRGEAPGPGTTADVLSEDDQGPEVEVEEGAPTWQSAVSRDVLTALTPREIERQEVINELLHTERTHVRTLKVLDCVFYQRLSRDSILPVEDLKNIFSNLQEIIQLHAVLSEQMAAVRKRTEGPVVGSIGDDLLTWFSGEEEHRIKQAVALFCSNLPSALELIKTRQKKDQKFASFMQEAESNRLCRRLQLKDIIPVEMQRLTKYPLLLDNIAKYTDELEERRKVKKAAECCKKILNHLNQAVKEAENTQRLKEYQRRLDLSSLKPNENPVVLEVKNLDLTKKKLIHEGPLSWKLAKDKAIDMYTLLLEDVLVLLQRQDERLILKLHGKNLTSAADSKLVFSPVIRLSTVLVRPVATDHRSFFVLSMSDNVAQIYELTAQTISDQRTWQRLITQCADSMKARLHSRHTAVCQSDDERTSVSEEDQCSELPCVESSSPCDDVRCVEEPEHLQENPEEQTHQHPQENPEENLQQDTHKHSDENPQQHPEENPQDHPEENTQHHPEENTQHHPEENTQHHPEENPQHHPEENPQQHPEENPQDHPEENTQHHPEENTQHHPEENTQHHPEENPEEQEVDEAELEAFLDGQLAERLEQENQDRSTSKAEEALRTLSILKQLLLNHMIRDTEEDRDQPAQDNHLPESHREEPAAAEETPADSHTEDTPTELHTHEPGPAPHTDHSGPAPHTDHSAPDRGCPRCGTGGTPRRREESSESPEEPSAVWDQSPESVESVETPAADQCLQNGFTILDLCDGPEDGAEDDISIDMSKLLSSSSQTGGAGPNLSRQLMTHLRLLQADLHYLKEVEEKYRQLQHSLSDTTTDSEDYTGTVALITRGSVQTLGHLSVPTDGAVSSHGHCRESNTGHVHSTRGRHLRTTDRSRQDQAQSAPTTFTFKEAVPGFHKLKSEAKHQKNSKLKAITLTPSFHLLLRLFEVELCLWKEATPSSFRPHLPNSGHASLTQATPPSVRPYLPDSGHTSLTQATPPSFRPHLPDSGHASLIQTNRSRSRWSRFIPGPGLMQFSRGGQLTFSLVLRCCCHHL